MIQAPRLALLLACSLGCAWLLSLVGLLNLDLGQAWDPPAIKAAFVVAAILLRTLLHTGLFIVAHDAMHGVYFPAQPRLNGVIGQLFLGLYGALPYRSCLEKHHRHHLYPATSLDPDFHQGDGRFIGWYLQFMRGYLSISQLRWLLAGWLLLWLASAATTPNSLVNVLLFAIVPLLLSSLQLFTFGTYLPHRGHDFQCHGHRCASIEVPGWLSLLACYHFGYHLDHHGSPQLAWFELPRCRQDRLA